MKIVNNFFSKKIWFGILMVISTLTLSISAAYYSVFGLSSLFAGAKFEVMIMASALEFSKLIVASYLHNNWNKINTLLKTYLTMGVLILMLITSAGIYGFLTSAYQKTADQLGVLDKQTEVVELKKNRFEEQLDAYQLEKEQLNKSISELSKGLSNNVIQYTDKDGNIITTTSSATRNVLESQLNDSKEQRNLISIKIEALTDSITKLDLIVLDIQSNNEVAAEIGPLRYLSKITGKSMDVIVNWFTLLIVFVFDPLAVAMVIAINKYIDNAEDHPKQQKNDSFGSASDLSKKDVEVILEANENPPQPTEKLKEDAKVYEEESKKEFYGETKPPIKRKYNDSVKSAENLK
jgi:hypothetical protein